MILRVSSAGVSSPFLLGVLPQGPLRPSPLSRRAFCLTGVERCCTLPAQGVPWVEDVARFHVRAPPGVPSTNDLKRLQSKTKGTPVITKKSPNLSLSSSDVADMPTLLVNSVV